MKQSLQLRLGQQLSMTPQLQQAIKLLQLSTLDLQQEIQQALESNMMLEVDENEESPTIEPEKDKLELKDSQTSEGSQSEIPDELPIDSSWDDIYEAPPSIDKNMEMPDFESQRSVSESLQQHLIWQLELAPFSERDHAIAIAIIDSINNDGYIDNKLEDIYEGLLSQLDELEYNEVLTVLHRVQNFEPIGVAALDLSDCLRLQLLQLPIDTPYRAIAIQLVSEHLDLLAGQERLKLLDVLSVKDEEFSQTMQLIRSLNPKPGNFLENSKTEYIIPDVFVEKKKGLWLVDLNPDIAPKLRVNSVYSKMIKRADNSADNTCMKNHLQEARWFIKSLHSRNDTLLRVARSIVEKQTGFLEYGAIAMKPMVLRNIAEELELHESTISRVTNQKYMHTPNGIIEFKYFFSSHVSTTEGGECSAVAIRALIKELVETENPKKPLSDNKISLLLEEKGINVARRTIAKYREALSIPSSSQRKRLV